jgi:hypothetical protein
MISCKNISLVNVFHIALAVSWIRWAVAGLTARNFDFDLSSAQVGFTVGKLAPRQFTLSKGDDSFSFLSNMQHY